MTAAAAKAAYDVVVGLPDMLKLLGGAAALAAAAFLVQAAVRAAGQRQGSTRDASSADPGAAPGAEAAAAEASLAVEALPVNADGVCAPQKQEQVDESQQSGSGEAAIAQGVAATSSRLDA